ncbi:MAG: DNA-3-methyladenine glycosylase I [Solobacterium sp.]|nr:DNA-3-methyladenine glycosylase I [Solobacterium sp.]
MYENDRTTNELSDLISKDLYKRGMRFVGSVIINSHEDECFKLMYNSGHGKDYSE